MVYSGTGFNINMLTESGSTQYFNYRPFQLLAIVDFIPSFILDSALLPFTIAWTLNQLGLKENRIPKKVIRKETIKDLEGYIQSEQCTGIFNFYKNLEFKQLSKTDKVLLNDLSKFIYKKGFCNKKEFYNFNKELQIQLFYILKIDDFNTRNRKFILAMFQKELYLSSGIGFDMFSHFEQKKDISASGIVLNRLLYGPKLSNDDLYKMIKFIERINYQPHINILYSMILRR